jgi:hypothetical protein
VRLKPAQVYPGKAKRLRDMAAATDVGNLRDALRDLAREYEESADLIENAGTPTSRGKRVVGRTENGREGIHSRPFHPQWTITIPVMCGCTAQKYRYLPGLVKVKENLSSVSRPPDRKVRGLSSESTVCGVSS